MITNFSDSVRYNISDSYVYRHAPDGEGFTIGQFSEEQLSFIYHVFQGFSDFVKFFAISGQQLHACQQDFIACSKNIVWSFVPSITTRFLKLAVQEVSNAPLTLIKGSYHVAKWALYQCEGRQTCDTIRFSGRKIQTLAENVFSPIETFATQLLSPNNEEIYKRQLRTSIEQHGSAPVKFSAAHLILPALFAKYCFNKSLENGNNALYHLNLLFSLNRNEVITTLYKNPTTNMKGSADVGQTISSNYTVGGLSMDILFESLFTLAWGACSYLTFESIYDVLKAAEVAHPERFIIATFVAPKFFKMINDFRSATPTPTHHFGSGPTIPQETLDAINVLAENDQDREKLNPFHSIF